MRTLLLVLIALLAASPVQAKKVYKIVRPDGTVHYTDRKPEDGETFEVIGVRAEQQSIAALRLDGLARERHAVVSNRVAGVIEVELRFGASDNVHSEPALPLRTTIPADAELSIATIRPVDEAQAASFGLEFSAVPGDPRALPDGSVYQMPLEGDWRIDQGFGGSFSHTDVQSRFAIDLAADEGTPVVAARDGTVMQVEDDFEGAGLDREKFGGRANHIRVEHTDGTMAVYAHLKPESVLVHPGQRVRTGQRLGASGNTGFSTGPHLHFAVQINRGMELVSVPFRLAGASGPIAIPDSTE